MKSDQERVSKLLTDTVTLLCKNGLVYSQEIKVQGLLGITLDKNEVFLVHINELIPGNVAVPSSERSATKASSEPSAVKKNTGASSSKVVDLTRVADDPRPVPQSFSSQSHRGPVAAGRKHRPPVAPVQPATMMIPQQHPQQQVSPRMQHGLRPRMSSSPLPTPMASQFASNYLARLHQQVARGMSPRQVMPPVRQRAVNRRTQEVMPSQTYSTDDDDEDVVIVGTGHEEPSPGWSSPMRKRPLPSRMPLSPVTVQKHSPSRSHQASSQRPAVHDTSVPVPIPTVIAHMRNDDVDDIEATLELTADDIPTSVEDMIMKIVPTALTTPKKRHSTMAEVPAEVYQGGIMAAESEMPLASEDRAVVTQVVQPLTMSVVSTVADDVSETEMASLQKSAENNGEDASEPLQPFIYTDIACDVVSNISEM